ncbi:MAG: response regulator [Oceanicaulis sp.]
MSAPLTILLVDDDPCERIFLEDALEEIDCTATLEHRECGRDALDLLRRERPEIMVLDLRMPGMTGFEVLKAVRARQELDTMKICVVSNSMIEADRKTALAMGAQDYRVKPISSDGYAVLARDVCALARCCG